MIVPLGGGAIACGIQQVASQPMQLRLLIPLIGGFNDLRSLDKAIQALARPPEPCVGLSSLVSIQGVFGCWPMPR